MAAVSTDWQAVRDERARRWFQHPEIDGAVMVLVGALVERQAKDFDRPREATPFAVVERIVTAAVAHVRTKATARRREAEATAAMASGRWLGEVPPPAAAVQARHRIDRDTIAADPALAAFLAAVEGDDDAWPRLLAEARAHRWRAVARWRQIGAGLLG